MLKTLNNTFIYVFLGISLIFSISFYLFISSKYDDLTNKLNNESKIYLTKKSTELDSYLNELRKKINTLELFVVENLKNIDNGYEESIDHIKNDFTFFMEDKRLYKIRLIDLYGNEVVKVYRQGGKLHINSNIQNKSQRYYFIEAKKLKKNEIYMSELDLSLENGEIVYPVIPTIRLVKPVYVNNEKFAYIVISYNTENFLKSLKSNQDKQIGILLLNKDGYYLSGFDKKDEFGFMYNNTRLNFKEQYSPIWDQINKKESERVSFDNKIFFLKEYNPLKIVSPNRSFKNLIHWHIVSYYDNSLISQKIKSEFILHYDILIYAFIVITLLSFFITKLIRMINEKEQQLISQSNLAMMGDMISMIAHQWRQPLGNVSALITDLQVKQSLYGKVDDKLLENNLKEVTSTIQELSQTIDDFRNFYKTADQFNKVDINSVIDTAIGVVKKLYEADKIKIIKDYSKDSLEIKTNERELVQVILNLLSNAHDAILENNRYDGEIVVSTYVKNNKLFISIQDNGGGVPEDIIKKIFEPYFSTKGKNGTGIGLYMSHIIIRRLNGHIKVYNTQKGAKFVLSFNIPNKLDTINRKKLNN